MVALIDELKGQNPTTDAVAIDAFPVDGAEGIGLLPPNPLLYPTLLNMGAIINDNLH